MENVLEKVIGIVQEMQNVFDERNVFLMNPVTMRDLGNQISERLNPITFEKSYLLGNKYVIYPSFKIPKNSVGVTTEAEYQVIKDKF